MKESVGIKVIVVYNSLNFVLTSLVKITGTENTVLYDSITLTEYLLFALFIWLLVKSTKIKLAVLIVSIAYTAFFILYSVFNEVTFLTLTIPISVETIFILIFSFYSLYEQMNDTTTLFIYNKPAFWIILGMVLYLAGCFFIYLYASYLPNDELNKLWLVTNIFSILKNIFFCIAIYINAKPPKENLQYDVEISSLN